MSYNLSYTAAPTCARFMLSKSTRKIISGPVGSGKTSACIMAILQNAIQQEPDNDGIRRTRHLVIRGTIPLLRTTTIKSFLDWLPPEVFGRYLSSEKTYYLEFSDVRAEILFLALETADDIAKLLSLETTTAYINEGKEVAEVVINGLIGTKRVGRFPSRKAGPGATYPCIMMDTNMPAWGTFHQKVMEGEEGDWETFKQPGGRTPEAENLEFLPPDYYSTEGLTEEYIKTMIDAQYGDSKEGMPVFKDTFVPDFHIAKEPLLPITSEAYPLIIGVDAGLTPAATIGQMAPSGRVHVLAECYTPKGESMGMERFLDTKLIPMLRNRFPNCKTLVVVDPAAMQRGQATEETVFQIIGKKGLKVIPGPTNKPDLRIGSAEVLFGRSVEGKAGLLIDPGCTGLISALKSGYRYDVRRSGEVEDKPLKDHPNSDLADSLTYFTSYIAGPAQVEKRGATPVKMVSMAGWV